jgi:NADPH2:quinone reductase
VIDVRTAGVCFPDLLLSKGEYQLKLPPPLVVVRAAPPKSGFLEGERVSAFGILCGHAERNHI